MSQNTSPDNVPSATKGTADSLAAPGRVGAGGTNRSDAEIVARTEEAARFLAGWRWGGMPESDGHFLRNSSNAKLLACWDAACVLQEIMTDSDARNAAAEVDGAGE